MSARRLVRLVSAVASVFGALAMFVFVPAASAEVGQITVGIRSDAWYSTGPVGCSSPVGCPPVGPPAPSYPADTLHVEVTLGTESARTYLALDLSRVPFDAELTDGYLTLPLSAAADAGTTAPETASLRACLATAPFPDDAEGSTEQPPATDCDVTSPALFADNAFTLDLGPFMAARDANPDAGIALVPAEDAAPTDSWHLAFDARDRRSPDVRPLSAALTYVVPDGAGPPPPGPGRPPAASSESVLTMPPATTTEPFARPAPVVTTDPPRLSSPPVASGFRYPVVMLLPLALLIGGSFLVSTFTRDATPPLGYRVITAAAARGSRGAD